MTVREFLDIHPDADLDLRTPVGRIYLDAAVRRRLESGRPVIADSGSPKTAVYVLAGELLEQAAKPIIREKFLCRDILERSRMVRGQVDREKEEAARELHTERGRLL